MEACDCVLNCHCVYCGDCGGSGQIRIPSFGYPEWDIESCSNCGGTGVVEMCVDCQDEYEREECA